MDITETVKKIIEDILLQMSISATVTFEESVSKGLVFNIQSQDSQLLIGRQGANLHALQSLVRQIAVKQLQSPEPIYFSVDVDDYKSKREWYLKETAKAAVQQIKRTGRGVALEPMPNYERRIIHSYLQENSPDVYTESTGLEPARRIVIKLK